VQEPVERREHRSFREGVVAAAAGLGRVFGFGAAPQVQR